MVCDLARDQVLAAVAPLGDAVRWETVPGEGTLFCCLDPSRAEHFRARVQQGVRRAAAGDRSEG